jgi:hypothetical protein
LTMKLPRRRKENEPRRVRGIVEQQDFEAGQ